MTFVFCFSKSLNINSPVNLKDYRISIHPSQYLYNIICFSKNNLLFYGLVPDFTPEIPSMLVQRIHDLFKFNLGMSRQIQLQKVKVLKIINRINRPSLKVSRLTTGPEIRGCRPVLVAFLQFKVKFPISMF